MNDGGAGMGPNNMTINNVGGGGVMELRSSLTVSKGGAIT